MLSIQVSIAGTDGRSGDSIQLSKAQELSVEITLHDDLRIHLVLAGMPLSIGALERFVADAREGLAALREKRAPRFGLESQGLD